MCSGSPSWIERRAQAPVGRVRPGCEQLVQRVGPRLPVQARASDEHIVHLEHAGSNLLEARARGGRSRAGGTAPRARLEDLRRGKCRSSKATVLSRGAGAVCASSSSLGRTPSSARNASRAASSASPPLRAESVELGEFGFSVGHNFRLPWGCSFRIREDPGRGLSSSSDAAGRPRMRPVRSQSRSLGRRSPTCISGLRRRNMRSRDATFTYTNGRLSFGRVRAPRAGLSLRGAYRSRTGVLGFADPCLTTRPRRRAAVIVSAPTAPPRAPRRGRQRRSNTSTRFASFSTMCPSSS